MEVIEALGKIIFSEAGIVALLLFVVNVVQWFERRALIARNDSAFQSLLSIATKTTEALGKLTATVELVKDRLR